MELIFHFILWVLYTYISCKNFYNYGYLQKDGNRTVGNGGSIFLNTNEFKGSSNVYLQFEVTNGFFEEEFLYYGGFSSTPYSVDLESTKDSYYISRVTRKYAYYSDHSWKDSIDETAYFKIKIPDEPYLFVSVPYYTSLSGSITVSFGSTLSVGEIVGIGLGGCFGIAIIIVGILIYCQKRKKRFANNNFQPTNNNPATLI